MEKTKVVISGEEPMVRMESGRYPCGCCGRGVGENSVWCAGCERWCHQRRSGVRDVRRAGVNFRCPTCVGGGRREVGMRQVQMGVAPVEVVESLCYLVDVLRCEGGVEATVKGRIACAWKSWRELTSLLVNLNIPLGSRAQVYRACVRSVLMYGVKTWATTKQLEALLIRCDVRMLRPRAAGSAPYSYP